MKSVLVLALLAGAFGVGYAVDRGYLPVKHVKFVYLLGACCIGIMVLA